MDATADDNDDDDGCGADEILRAHVGAMRAAADVDADIDPAVDACERLLSRSNPARDQADAMCVWALFARPVEHWHARTRGQARTALFEIGTVALGVFANARIERGGDPVVNLALPPAAAVATASVSPGDAISAEDAAHATNVQTARNAVEQLRRSLRDSSLIGVLGNPHTALHQQLRTLADLVAWEYRIGPGVHAAVVDASCLSDDEHVRLRAEVVNWLMAWVQIAAVCAHWRLGSATTGEADNDGTEDPWLARRVDVERTITRSDQYVRRATDLSAELLAPAGIAAVYKRVFPSSAPVSVQTMITRLVPNPTFALICTRCVREYNGLVWANPAALLAASEAPSSAQAAQASPAGGAVAHAPVTSLYRWQVRLAPAPPPMTTGAEIRHAAAAITRTAAAVATGSSRLAGLGHTHTLASGPATGAVAIPTASALAMASSSFETEAAAPVSAEDALLARQRVAPLPAWARAATEDAWVLQAWFAAVDRQMVANGTGIAATKAGAGAGAAHQHSTCRARYFVRTCDAGAMDRVRGRPVVGGQRPLPTLWYAMPGALAVHCHVCGRSTQHTNARAAVNAWLREVRGPCHNGGDEFGQPLLV